MTSLGIGVEVDGQVALIVVARFANKVAEGYHEAVVSRADSFPRAVEFRAQPQNLGFCRRIEPQNFTVEFVFLMLKFRGI